MSNPMQDYTTTAIRVSKCTLSQQYATLVNNSMICCEQFGWTAEEGVLTFVRLPHDSGRVPVRLLPSKAMKLSCSKDKPVIQGYFAKFALYMKQRQASQAEAVMSTDVTQPCLVYDLQLCMGSLCMADNITVTAQPMARLHRVAMF